MSDYDIGYGKPPKAHRFQKGQSGNPNGKGKAASFDKLDVITKVYSEPITLTIDGKQKRMTKFEAAVRMTLAQCLRKGDARSFERVMKLIEDQGGNWRERYAQEMKEAGDAAMIKIGTVLDRVFNPNDHTPGGSNSQLSRDLGGEQEENSWKVK